MHCQENNNEILILNTFNQIFHILPSQLFHPTILFYYSSRKDAKPQRFNGNYKLNIRILISFARSAPAFFYALLSLPCEIHGSEE